MYQHAHKFIIALVLLCIFIITYFCESAYFYLTLGKENDKINKVCKMLCDDKRVITCAKDDAVIISTCADNNTEEGYIVKIKK